MIAVTSRLLCEGPFLERVGRIASARPELVVLREKDLSSEDYLSLARDCLVVCSGHGVRLSINTHVDVARELGVGAVHLPMPVLRGADLTGLDLVGASVHSADEAVEAEGLGADYLIAGHVFATACKPSEPRGIPFLREVCSSVSIPVYAIGGVTPGNIAEVMSAGAAGAAAMSSVMTCEDPSALVSALGNKDILTGHRRHHGRGDVRARAGLHTRALRGGQRGPRLLALHPRARPGTQDLRGRGRGHGRGTPGRADARRGRPQALRSRQPQR